MYLEAADLLGTSPIIHSDFWLSEQLLCAEFLKKMPKFNELATEDKACLKKCKEYIKIFF
jgi:hypothetical protein